MNWFNRMKSLSNKFFGSSFNEESSEMEVEKWFDESEQVTFEQRIENVKSEIKKQYEDRINSLEGTIEDFKKSLKVEADKVEEVKSEQELSIQMLSEQLSETNKLVKELAEANNSKFEAIERENADKVKAIEEASNDKISELNETHRLEVEALKEEIAKLKGQKSGGQEVGEPDVIKNKKEEKGGNTNWSAADFLKTRVYSN